MQCIRTCCALVGRHERASLHSTPLHLTNLHPAQLSSLHSTQGNDASPLSAFIHTHPTGQPPSIHPSIHPSIRQTVSLSLSQSVSTQPVSQSLSLTRHTRVTTLGLPHMPLSLSAPSPSLPTAIPGGRRAALMPYTVMQPFSHSHTHTSTNKQPQRNHNHATIQIAHLVGSVATVHRMGHSCPTSPLQHSTPHHITLEQKPQRTTTV